MAAVRAVRGLVNGAGPGGPREQVAAITRDYVSQPRLSECGARRGAGGLPATPRWASARWAAG